MSQISRRLFFLLLGVLIPGVITQKSGAATTKKPSPTPTTKKPSPQIAARAAPQLFRATCSAPAL